MTGMIPDWSDGSTDAGTEDVASAAEKRLEPAGFWIRAAARVIDWLVTGFITVLTMMLFAFGAGVLQAMTGRPAQKVFDAIDKTTFIGWIGGVVVMICYHSLFEGVAGSTIGKRLIGLHVITDEGIAPIRFVQAVRRALAFLVDALFFGAIAAGEMNKSPEKQRIGDHWAGTRVVRRRSLPPDVLPSRLQFFAAFVAAMQTALLVDILRQWLELLWLGV